MIEGAVFCPNPPALVPEVAAGAAAELDGLRAACTAALRRAAQRGAGLVLVGAGTASAFHPASCRGSLAGFGVAIEISLGAPDGPGELDLPLSLTVGAWLVREALGDATGATAFSIGPDFETSPAAAELVAITRRDTVVLLVMADGSARRSVTAPGYLDERAAGFDATVSSALAAGDPSALSQLDPDLGAELLAAGVPAWRVAGELMAGELMAGERTAGRRYAAELLYDDAPYGVGYFAAAWWAASSASSASSPGDARG